VNIPLRKQFGARIRELRLASGISQEAFADKCGYARSYMSRVERGLANPSLDAVAVFAVALKVEVEELFKTTGTAPPPEKPNKPAILVPFAKDGTCFNPNLRRLKDGDYMVGEKDREVTFKDFDAALEYLRKMKVAYWRRPNQNGNWGRVKEIDWDVLPK
jgi:transcriptional regulator with XRE-family HTH domain